jgi:flagellar biosynthesis component FlhA
MEPEVRTWMMAALTIVFVLLYVLALVGKVPDANEVALGHVAPIVAVIIGYYFGRVPAEKHQKDLKEQIEREATKAKEEEKKASAAKEAEVQQAVERRAADEKIMAARAALSTAEISPDAVRAAFPSMRAADAAAQDGLRYAVGAALKILGG